MPSMEELTGLRADFARLHRSLVVLKWMTGVALGGVTVIFLKSFFPG